MPFPTLPQGKEGNETNCCWTKSPLSLTKMGKFRVCKQLMYSIIYLNKIHCTMFGTLKLITDFSYLIM